MIVEFTDNDTGKHATANFRRARPSNRTQGSWKPHGLNLVLFQVNSEMKWTREQVKKRSEWGLYPTTFSGISGVSTTVAENYFLPA